MRQRDGIELDGPGLAMTGRRSAAMLLAVGVLSIAAGSCRHQPMYPEIGSALITSDPAGAEIIIDGQSTRRMTPCKIDGLAVGAHSLTLRKQWFRILKSSITIKPGETRRQSFALQAVRHTIHNNRFNGYYPQAMAYDPVHERIYFTSSGSTTIQAYAVRETVAVLLYAIEMGFTQDKVAVSAPANRLFCTLSDGRIGMADLNSPTTVRYLTLPGVPAFRALEQSPDGNVVMAADSAGKRLALLDARLGSVIKFVNLPAGPSDAVFGPGGNVAYVTMPQTRTMARVDLVNGVVIATMATGNSPGELFWSCDHARIGWCNRADMSVTVVDVARWNAATGTFHVGGGGIYGPCPTSEPEYNLVIVSGTSLNLYYQPTWGIGQVAYSERLTGLIRKVMLSSDRRYHYVLCSGGLSVIESEY